MLQYKPDYEQAKRRIDAWWNGEILDRAVTFLQYPRPDSECIREPVSNHATLRERWMDVEYQSRLALCRAANWVHAGDQIPLLTPNLGPASFAAVLGCEMGFAENTTWVHPMLDEWDEEALAGIALDASNEYYRTLVALHGRLAEMGEGKFLVGVTPQLGGGDTLAAIRGQEALCFDLIERPEAVKPWVEHFARLQCQWYDVLYGAATRGGRTPTGGWLGMIGDGKCYIPQSDFSALVSPGMYREILRPGVAIETAHMDRSIYHLDGLQALNHLDAVLELPDVHAVQWGPPPQHWDWHEWVGVYQRIQKAGKAFIVYVPARDLPELFPHLRPEGAWLYVGAVKDRDEAQSVLGLVERWGK